MASAERRKRRELVGALCKTTREPSVGANARGRAADKHAVKTGSLIGSAILRTWGTAVLVYAALSGGPSGTSSYQTGQILALVFAAAMIFFGVRGVRNELRKRAE